MSRVFKIRGSGPMAGFAAYGEFVRPGFSKDAAVIRLDDEYFFEDGSSLTLVTVSIETGAVQMGFSGETDMLYVLPQDLPRLQEKYLEWECDVENR